MEVFEFGAKSRVKRVFEAVKESFEKNCGVKVLGIGDGAVKAVAVVEKLKAGIANVDQVNEIVMEEGKVGIRIELRLV